MRMNRWIKTLACGLVCVGSASAQVRLGQPVPVEETPPNVLPEVEKTPIAQAIQPAAWQGKELRGSPVLSPSEIAAQQYSTSNGINSATPGSCAAAPT